MADRRHDQMGLHAYNYADPLWDMLFGIFRNSVRWEPRCDRWLDKPNALRDRLAGMSPATTTAAEIRALRREELSATASAMLHELYFANLSGGSKGPGTLMVSALEEHFCGVDRWRCEFRFGDARWPLAG
jgi:hypothetical protein